MGRSQPTSAQAEAREVRWTRLRRAGFMMAVLAVVLVVLASSSHVRIGLQSAAFLTEVFPDSPVYPARWFAEDPHRVFVQFPHEDAYHSAFLYHPGEAGCFAGIVLYIGLGPEHGDSHLDRIARGFARNGIVVLIPVSEAMIDYRLGDDEHLVAASAFEYLQRIKHVNPDRVGMFGISVGGSVVANAAQEPHINQDVRMVNSLGGYFDARIVLGYMSVRAYEIDGEWIEWEPSSATIRATRNSIVPLMPSEDRVALWELFGSEVTEIPSDLSEDGEALARVLVNRDPDRIHELLDQLPAPVDDFLRAISPEERVEDLHAETLLLHDRYDHVLPYSESVRFAQLAERHAPGGTYLTVIEQFHHVRPDEEGDRLSLVGDSLRLYRHIFRMHQALDDRGPLTSPLSLLPGVSGDRSCD